MLDPLTEPRVAAGFRQYWWLFLIRGIFALALGVCAVLFPGATLAVTVIFIGAYLIVDGIFTIVKALRVMRTDAHWWALLLEGILGVVVGLAIFEWPGLSIVSLAYLVGYWAIITGVLGIFTALRLRTHVKGEWLYLLASLVSIVFGLFVLFAPATGLVYIVLMIAIYGFVVGVTMIGLAFRARTLPA